MLLELILFGFVLFVLILVASYELTSQQQCTLPSVNFVPRIPAPYYPPRTYRERPIPPRERSVGSLVENWRKSIIGLIELADENLKFAKERMRLGDSKAAIQSASTSVENIARALIHCYGGKPDIHIGQEEALRMLSPRFKGYQKIEFEKAIEKVSSICNVTCSQQTIFFDKKRANQTLEYAIETVGMFKRIIIKNFVTEIPELSEVCPKSH